jgi:hypothetical protein
MGQGLFDILGAGTSRSYPDRELHPEYAFQPLFIGECNDA